MPYPMPACRGRQPGGSGSAAVYYFEGATATIRFQADRGTYQDNAGGTTTPATADTDLVHTWVDQGGSNTIQYPSTTNGPVLKTGSNGINSQPVVLFTLDLLYDLSTFDSSYNTAFNFDFAVNSPGSGALEGLWQFGPSAYIGFRSGVCSLYFPPVVNTETQFSIPGGNGVVIGSLDYNGSTLNLWLNGTLFTSSRSGNLSITGNLGVGDVNGSSKAQNIGIWGFRGNNSTRTESEAKNIHRELHVRLAQAKPARAVIVGDSLSIYDGTGAPGANNWPNLLAADLLAAGQSWTFLNNAVGGRTIGDFATNFASEVVPDFHWLSGPGYGSAAGSGYLGDGTGAVGFLWGGTNNLIAGMGGSDIYDLYRTYALNWKAAYPMMPLIGGTMIDRIVDLAHWGSQAAMDAERAIFNALMLTNDFLDQTVLLHLIPEIGPNGQHADTNSFVDGIHLTQTRYALAKDAFAAKLALVTPY